MSHESHSPRLLIVDDDQNLCSVLSRSLSQRGFNVTVAHDVEGALAIAPARRPRYAVLDLKLPGGSGLTLLQSLKRLCPEARIVVMSGYASIATAVQAVKLGAHDYLPKPANIEDIVAALSGDTPVPPATVGEKPLSVSRLAWEHIQRVLCSNDGNISATARQLRMHRRTLQRKVNKRPSHD